MKQAHQQLYNNNRVAGGQCSWTHPLIKINIIMNSNQSNSNSNDRLDRLEAIVAHYVETSVKESAALKLGLSELKSGLDETRQLVNSVARSAQANSDAIAQLRRERQATDKQVAQLTREVADFVKTTKEGVAKLIEDRATMFEMIQSLNDDRVKWAENLASIASSLNQLVTNRLDR